MNEQQKELPKSIGKPALRALLAAGLQSTNQAALLSDKELLRLHGVGPKAVRILREHNRKVEIIDGYTVKYHANGITRWSKGKMVNGKPDGYWEWYRLDGTLKRSGYFDKGETIGEWTTYDNQGSVYKITNRD